MRRILWMMQITSRTVKGRRSRIRVANVIFIFFLQLHLTFYLTPINFNLKMYFFQIHFYISLHKIGINQSKTGFFMKKYRADELLCLRGHCSGKEEAARLIMAGKVRTSPDAVVQKGSQMLPEDTPLLVDSGCPYVSRGALKLKVCTGSDKLYLRGCGSLHRGLYRSHVE